MHLVFHLRPGRRKALEAARTEARSLLRDLDASTPKDSPLSDRGGVFQVDLPEDHFLWALQRFPRLGYSHAVDLLEPLPGKSRRARVDVLWGGTPYRLSRLYDEDDEAVREAAPDRREFVLPTDDGGSRTMR